MFQGTGVFNSYSMTFSGDVICDPSYYGTYCGQGGYRICDSDTNCVWLQSNPNPSNSSSYNATLGAIVNGSWGVWMTARGIARVKGLPVNTVVKIY